eukprot:6487006-Prymnesium_polylepis.1
MSSFLMAERSAEAHGAKSRFRDDSLWTHETCALRGVDSLADLTATEHGRHIERQLEQRLRSPNDMAAAVGHCRLAGASRRLLH